MEEKQLPAYAEFEDYRYSQRIAVFVRWFVIVTWLFLQNYRFTLAPYYYINNAMVITVAVLNAYVTWRIWKGRPVTYRYVVALSVMDLSFIPNPPKEGVRTAEGGG